MPPVIYTDDEVLASEQDFTRRKAAGDNAVDWEYMEWINALRRVQGRG